MPFPPDINQALADALRGLACTRIEHPSDWFWQITFGNNAVVFGIETQWRLLKDGSIAFGDEDDGQQFGLPKPVDGSALCLEILKPSKVVTSEIRRGTADVTIAFDNGAVLELLNGSAGYEGWSCTFGEWNIVGRGGGELAIMGRA